MSKYHRKLFSFENVNMLKFSSTFTSGSYSLKIIDGAVTYLFLFETRVKYWKQKRNLLYNYSSIVGDRLTLEIYFHLISKTHYIP